jgi:uncharacterized protein
VSLMDDLLTLYRIDAQLRGLQSRLDVARDDHELQVKRLEQLVSQRQNLELLRRQVQASLANQELEATTLDERSAKLRDELNGSQTNKQYTAVLNELNVVKAARADLDARMLSEMERVETLKADANALDTSITEREKVRDHAAAQLKERRSEIGDRLNELQKQRDAAAAHVPERALDVFNKMGDCYEGEAMAAIEEVDRRNREYSCTACHMHLPFEVVSQLTSGGNRLMQCTACQRILFIQEETRGALVKK